MVTVSFSQDEEGRDIQREGERREGAGREMREKLRGRRETERNIGKGKKRERKRQEIRRDAETEEEQRGRGTQREDAGGTGRERWGRGGRERRGRGEQEAGVDFARGHCLSKQCTVCTQMYAYHLPDFNFISQTSMHV